MKVLIASHNAGKLLEMQAILVDYPFEVVVPAQLGIRLTVEETGSDYRENALLKARAYALASGILTLADDSGLEVEVLQGAPGLFSARYSPRAGADDADRRHYLVEQILQTQASPPWKAQFVCTVAAVDPQGNERICEGACAGEIICEERGTGGFGYDPIFYLAQHGQTMAEIPAELKNRISHRAVALRRMADLLTDEQKRNLEAQ